MIVRFYFRAWWTEQKRKWRTRQDRVRLKRVIEAGEYLHAQLEIDGYHPLAYEVDIALNHYYKELEGLTGK